MNTTIKQSLDYFELTNSNWTCTLDVEGEDREIELGVCIEIIDREEEAKDINNPFTFKCYVVPLLKCLTEKGLDKVVHMSGLEPGLFDIHSFSRSICIDYGLFYDNNEPNCYPNRESVENHVQENVIKRISMIMLNIGFILDERMNSIGTTGWQILESIISGTDILEITFNKSD